MLPGRFNLSATVGQPCMRDTCSVFGSGYKEKSGFVPRRTLSFPIAYSILDTHVNRCVTLVKFREERRVRTGMQSFLRARFLDDNVNKGPKVEQVYFRKALDYLDLSGNTPCMRPLLLFGIG